MTYKLSNSFRWAGDFYSGVDLLHHFELTSDFSSICTARESLRDAVLINNTGNRSTRDNEVVPSGANGISQYPHRPRKASGFLYIDSGTI